MSVKPVMFYVIVCDEPGCDFDTSDLGSDYAAWGDEEGARIEWTESDLQELYDVTPQGGPLRHYCDQHRRPACTVCGQVVEPLVEDPDGDLVCRRCGPVVAS